VAGTVGSSLYLLGLVILYNMFGTLNMNGLSLLLKDVDSIYVAFPFLLMFIGLGVEAKLLPFNSWVKGILGSSTVLSGAMLASVYASASLLVFGRLLTNVFVMSDSLMLIVSVILAIGIFAGEAMAYSSTKLREVLLFSSIAQAAIAVLVFTYGFVGYGLLFVGFLGFSKMILFLVVNTMIDQRKTDEIDDYKGVFRNHLVIGISFSMIVLSVLGLPLFAGFMIKVGILQELVMSGNLIFPAIILISSVIEGVYFIKLLIALWYKESGDVHISFDLPLVYLSVIVALLVLILGIYYMPLHDFVNVLARGGLLW
jgi:multicomponent Na+:H+ antiporter subunit D